MPITVTAYAKINLTLEVLGRRDDGYHEVSTILQTVSLHDTITLEEASSLELTCDVPELSGPQNLAYQAAELLKEASHYDSGARITVTKVVPASAGLGGGSSDAAAVLRGLRALWGLRIGDGEMAEMAARLGSDVPFFLRGGTALARGRGELITPLPDLSLRQLIICIPDMETPNKTAFMYGLLTPEDSTDGTLTRALTEQISIGGPVSHDLLFNVFHQPAVRLFPEIARCKEAMVAAGLKHPVLAGAGPSLYAMLPEGADGRSIVSVIEQAGIKAHLVRTVSASDSSAVRA